MTTLDLPDTAVAVDRDGPGPVPFARVAAGRRLRRTVAMLGPAFVAAVAYVDPGNFATNLQAGSAHGYRLVWVVVLANVLAMPVQFLSAKVGIVTGASLPELCRRRMPRPVLALLWVQAEIVAMATDLAEFVGAAVGLNLLFGVPPLVAGGVTAAASFAVLALQARGHRPFERAVGALLFVVLAGFAYQLTAVHVDGAGAASGLVPRLGGTDELYLAAGILGATLMPHVVYLHSALTARRVSCADDEERSRVLRFERWDVAVALGTAGLVNVTMLALGAALFSGQGAGATSLFAVHEGLARMVGGGAALAFAVALLASGLASSGVGTLAGQVVMGGFVGVRLPLLVRRTVTMAPALVVLALGTDPTQALTFSQVLLSFGIPFALVPLLLVSRDRSIMGRFAHGRRFGAALWVVAGLVITLNATLLWRQFAG